MSYTYMQQSMPSRSRSESSLPIVLGTLSTNRARRGDIARPLLGDSQESLYLPQRGLQLQRGTELGNGMGIGALKEQQHAEVAEGVDVPGIESDDGFKLVTLVGVDLLQAGGS